ncbi:hypothetical protein H3146_02365, partial [Streptomyces sp. OF3]|nr:hypothetical protein [Streptomyces alkaliterrae]MQS05578.1 hypothetical protein [Streptomyces alkaliterrae]
MTPTARRSRETAPKPRAERPPRGLRAVRAGLFGVVCAVLAGAGHGTVSGHAVPPAVLLPAAVGTAALAWFGGERRRGPLAIVGTLVAAQTLLHLLFSLLAPGAHAA